MDCHRCIHISYSGCRYGRCSHPGHRNVVLRRGEDGSRPYNRMICQDFEIRKRCSNCAFWVRGKYYADGNTPADKGGCSLRISRKADECPMWKAGPTSSRNKQGKKQ